MLPIEEGRVLCPLHSCIRSDGFHELFQQGCVRTAPPAMHCRGVRVIRVMASQLRVRHRDRVSDSDMGYATMIQTLGGTSCIAGCGFQEARSMSSQTHSRKQEHRTNPTTATTPAAPHANKPSSNSTPYGPRTAHRTELQQKQRCNLHNRET